MAETFAKWQSFVSAPDLDRKLASTLMVSPAGIEITGTISLLLLSLSTAAIHFYAGTYFGTRAEYGTLNIEAQFGPASLIKVEVVEDWLGSVINLSEEEALQVIGSVVSL